MLELRLQAFAGIFPAALTLVEVYRDSVFQVLHHF